MKNQILSELIGRYEQCRHKMVYTQLKKRCVMTTRITVMGGGPGGYVAALKAALLGAEVTLIEKENLGGTCLNWGCIPSKIMKHSSELLLKFQNAKNYGLSFEGSMNLDMAALMKHKEDVLATQRKGIESLLMNRGVAIERGRGYIKDKGRVEVRLNEGGVKEVEFDRLILAVGTKPLNMEAFPFDHEKILSSDDLLSMESVPESITIVGGGVIGCEFAFILASMGAKVTVVEAMSRALPLPSVDESCSRILQREMKKRKIRLILDKVVQSTHEGDNGLILNLGPSPLSGKDPAKIKGPDTIETEKMAVCIGRTPLSGEIGLENIGLEINEKGWIDANSKMETSVESVYAIGDILGPEKIMLAHVASHEGLVAADNAMGGNEEMKYDAVPGAIFTMPEIGNVGLTESSAREKGIKAERHSVNFRSLGKAQAIGEITGEASLVTEADTKKILGVHITGPHATDLIAEGTLAVNKGLTAYDIAHTIHAHPTLAEILLEAALKATGTPLHG